MNDPVIAHVDFVDGVRRPVYEQLDGRQYVLLDEDGERVHGVWFLPPYASDMEPPLIVNDVVD
jgi:hypothetical protein